MKKIIYILALLSVTFFSGCELETGDYGYPKTLQGKIAYDAVENRLTQSVSLLDLMTKVDYYAQAPEDEKEGIKNYYLSRYTITNTDKTWILKNNNQEIIFTHNQKSLNNNGAVWTVKVNINLWDGQTVSIIEDKNFLVESLGDKDWKVTTKALKFYSPSLGYTYPTDDMNDSEIFIKGSKAYDKLPNLYDFKLEAGSGNLNMYSTKINYNILTPMSYTIVASQVLDLTPISGKLDIIADKDKITAEIIMSSYNNTQLEITFNGLTETYY